MQSNVIFAYILAAYIFYITAKGELAVYLDILRGGGQQPQSSAGANDIGSNSLDQTVAEAISETPGNIDVNQTQSEAAGLQQIQDAYGAE